MRAICLEVRDRMTFIPVMAISTHSFSERDVISVNATGKQVNAILASSYLLRRAGYPSDGSVIILVNLNDPRQSANDPYDWNSRTMGTAHQYIQEHWNELKTGDVIDVEFILGETTEKKVSERFER